MNILDSIKKRMKIYELVLNVNKNIKIVDELFIIFVGTNETR